MINRLRVSGTALGIVLVGAALSTAQENKQSRCFTTDDGAYPCQFRITDANGSFEIAAPDKPTYILQITQPGKAIGFAQISGETVRLPAEYLRRDDDPGCWQNTGTDAEICAW